MITMFAGIVLLPSTLVVAERANVLAQPVVGLARLIHDHHATPSKMPHLGAAEPLSDGGG